MVGENAGMRVRPITDADLVGLSGLRSATRQRLLDRQPATVFEALCILDIGRATTRELLKRGVLTDPDGVQHRGLTDEEFEKRWRSRDRDRALVQSS